HPRTLAVVPNSLLRRKLIRRVTRRYRARMFRVNTFSRCRFDAVVLGTLLLFDRRRLVVIDAWESFLVTAWTWILRRLRSTRMGRPESGAKEFRSQRVAQGDDARSAGTASANGRGDPPIGRLGQAPDRDPGRIGSRAHRRRVQRESWHQRRGEP